MGFIQTLFPPSIEIASEVVAAREAQASLDARIDTLKLVQFSSFETGDVATGTTTIPDDDSRPEITEGDEYLSLVHTPLDASNILLVQVVVHSSSSVGGLHSVALFKDGGTFAIASAGFHIVNSNFFWTHPLSHSLVAGTTSAITFTVRIGNSGAGTTTLNGRGSGRKHGGVLLSSIKISEFRP